MTNITPPILLNIPMPIRTPRLIIRNIMTGDGAAMHEAKIETWDELCKWMPWSKFGIGTIDDNEKLARQKHAAYILREDMMMGAFDLSGKLISCNGLHIKNWEVGQFDVGYWVRQSEMGKGYATEIANALTRFAFGALNARRVEIWSAEENHASRRVIEKLNFDLECIKKDDNFLPNGNLYNRAFYVRYNTDNLPPLDVNWG